MIGVGKIAICFDAARDAHPVLIENGTKSLYAAAKSDIDRQSPSFSENVWDCNGSRHEWVFRAMEP